MRKKENKHKMKLIVQNHILNNKKEYISVGIILLIGIVLGVIFLNHIEESGQNEVREYILNFIDNMKKQENTIDRIGLLKDSMKNNLIVGVILWFVGSTVVGIPLVYLYIGYKGFCLAYTISSCVAVLGIGKGIIFTLSALFLHNFLQIPLLLALGVSGINLYRAIIKDRKKENIKMEIIRHTVFSSLCILGLMITSVIEVYFSTNIFMFTVKYL